MPTFILILAAAVLLLTGCERPDPEAVDYTPLPTSMRLFAATPSQPTPTLRPTVPPTATAQSLVAQADSYPGTPTPDPPRFEKQDMRGGYGVHVVSAGETLGILAEEYDTTALNIALINNIYVDDFIAVGQEILVPAIADVYSPSFKIIPDSELVYGPTANGFDVSEVADFFGGYLKEYRGDFEGREMSGPEIVQLVAERFSINPRLLLALIEHQSGWLTQPTVADARYPLGYALGGYEGLHYQLFWAANLINYGFYGRSEGGLRTFKVGGALTVAFAPDINDGTAGIQHFFGGVPYLSYDRWLNEVGPDGFYATYNRLFGNPFANAHDPLWPPTLDTQLLSLPWEPGKTWYFTSGPHGGWGTGSAWAALDFAPQNDQVGCYQSDDWVTAISDGIVVRSSYGAVVIDRDGDGYAGAGWADLYMHLDSRERVPLWLEVKEGDRIGHPSCEGGYSNGTHLHLARTYNGRWVSADGLNPFNLSGWISQGLGQEYDGLLVRGDTVKEACNCKIEGNAITAD